MKAMKAHDFEFNGKRLSDFGFIICKFGSKGLDTVSNGANVTFNTIPTLNGAYHKLTSSNYEDCLETKIQICRNPCNSSDMEISSTTFRELTRWLCRKQFLKFKLLSKEYIDLYYEVVINVSRIEFEGSLVGLELEIQTNTPFALKEPKTINIDCKEGEEVYCWKKYQIDPEVLMLGYVTSTDEDAYTQSIVGDMELMELDGGVLVTEDNHILCDANDLYVTSNDNIGGYEYMSIGQVYKASFNDVSYEEGYIYPEMEIIIKKDGDLFIHNSVENRETYIAKCKANEVITLNYPIIQSSLPSSSHNIQNDFNWNFFRIANTLDNSRNDLIVSLPCTIKIEYSPVVKVGL